MKRSHRQTMPFERGSFHPALLLLAAVAIATAAGIVKADVLYDSTGMTEEGTWDFYAYNFIGGIGVYGMGRDGQAADDFSIANAYRISSVTADYLMNLGNLPADGVLVEFFEDIGGAPDNVPLVQVLSTSVVGEPIDVIPDVPAFRITADLSDADITLDAGQWWIAITPLDETPDGDRFQHLYSFEGNYGADFYVRDGGSAHGNGYQGFYGLDEWTLAGDIGGYDAGDLAMKIEGTPVSIEILPTGYTVLEGLLLIGGLEDLFLSDDQRMVVGPATLVPPDGPEPPVQIEIVATSPTQTPNELRFHYEGHVFMPDAGVDTRRRTSLFNYDTQSYDELDNRLAASSDEVFEIVVTANPEDYIEPRTGNMKTLITYKAEGLSGFLFAISQIDQTVWIIDP